MRTLQEKYNGIQEGKFSKDQFLVEARMQHPNLVTRFNGYDDAIQILKNRGMIREDFKEFSSQEKAKEEKAKEEKLGASKNLKIGDKIKVSSAAAKKLKLDADKEYTIKGFKEHGKGSLKSVDVNLGGSDSVNIEYVKKSIKEARLTNKSLTDYRYKPTNDMDKYPYEQILRGLRVELEGLNVLGTPTPEEYKKALAKVLKNLEKDEIFYTNQLAGRTKKVDLHDKMVLADKKNTVDTFNGMKKAELKEGIKNLIKKVLLTNIQEGYQPGDKVTFHNKNSEKTYKGTVIQGGEDGTFTFTAEDGKTYKSDGFGTNWKIEKEVIEGMEGEEDYERASRAIEFGVPEEEEYELKTDDTEEVSEDILESVSLKDLLD